MNGERELYNYKVKHCVIQLICIASFFFKPSYLFPQAGDYAVEFITTQDGLSHNSIFQIIQDIEGFIWVATEGGLNRYDGYKFKFYKLPDNSINTVFNDTSNGRKYLWIGTHNGGLIKFDKEKETFIEYANIPMDSTSISCNYINCIYKDKDGLYWIGTNGGGLNKFDQNTGKFTAFRYNPNDTNSINSDYIGAICEDHFGILWISTLGRGLDKFNLESQKFLHYSYPENSKGLESNVVWSLLEDINSTIWVGTFNGLFKYNRQNDEFIRHSFKNNNTQILNYGHIYSLSLDKEDILWISVMGRGVIGISKDRKSFIYYPHIPKLYNSLNSSLVKTVCRDRSGIIWVGNWGKGINKIIPAIKQFKCYEHIPGDFKSLPDEIINSITEGENRNLWLGTGVGLIRYDNGKFIRHNIFEKRFYENIYKVCVSKTGKLWLARERCLTIYNPITKRFNNYVGKYLIYSLPAINLVEKLFKASAEISCIKEVTNNQYITKEFNINKPTHLLVISSGEGDLFGLSDYGWITTENKKNIVWKMNYKDSRYSSDSYGGSFYNRVQISLLTLNPGKYLLHYCSNNEHAFGNWKGRAPDRPDFWGISVFPINKSIFHKLKHKIEMKSYYNLLPGELHDIVQDNKGKIWCVLIVAKNTIHYFDKINKQYIPFPVKIGNRSFPMIESIIKDNNSLWFVSKMNNVLIRKDQEDRCEIKFDLRNVINDSSVFIPDNAISCVYKDSKNNFWLGTDFGLFKYNLQNERIVQYKFEDLVSPNKIAGILEDNSGKLWISTGSNLIKFDPVKKVLRKYDSYDGLPNVTFSTYTNSCTKLKDGRLAFGGSNGLIIFHPDSIKDNPNPPPIVLTDFKLKNKSVAINDSSYLKKNINYAGSIELPYQENIFSIEFAALDYTEPAKNQYAYKLEGFHNDWTYTDAEHRVASYTNLDPGEYTFRVIGSNCDGIWNKVGASLNILILPPWWATWWFRAVASILLLSGLIFLYKLRINHLKLEKIRQEEFSKKLIESQEGERKRIAGELHDSLGQNLMIIYNDIQQYSQRKEIVPNELKSLFPEVKETIEEVREIARNLHPHQLEQLGLTKAVKSIIRKLSDSTKIDFHSNIEFIDEFIPQDLWIHIYRIIQEALTNIIKHSEATEVKIELKRNQKNIFMLIEDNGIGIKSILEKAKNGFGLENLKERARLLGSKLEISSPLNKGVRVLMNIPVKNLKH